MNPILFLTGNEIKFRNCKNTLIEYNILVEQEKMVVQEIQCADVMEIAEFSDRYAGERLNKPVVKLDVAFEIRALNGFPGPFVKYINQWLSPEKLLQLMENETDRYAQFVDCVSLYQPESQQCRSFLSKTSGYIADEIHGKNGWGIDQIFIPEGYTDTLASYSDKDRTKIENRTYWQSLAEYLRKTGEQG